MTIRGLYLTVLLFCFTAVLYPQQTTPAYSPAVLDLRTSTRDALVLLNWSHTADSRTKSLQILRSSKPITPDTLLNASFIGKVEAGHTAFTDLVTAPGPYYYAVLIYPKETPVNSILIPYRNTTVFPAIVKSVTPLLARAAYVRNLRATLKDKQVKLEFNSTTPDRELAVYRSRQAITTKSLLQQATQIAIIDSQQTVYIDRPSLADRYYYGIYDVELLQKNLPIIILKENTLAVPVFSMVAPGQQTVVAEEFLNPLPGLISKANQNVAALPEFHLQDIPTYLEAITKGQTISAPTRSLIRSLNTTGTEIFSIPQPIMVQTAPENQKLRSALLAFRSGNYNETTIRIEGIIDKETLTPQDRTLAHFYLGQSYYWINLKQKALLEMIKIQDVEILRSYVEQYIGTLLTEGTPSTSN